MSEKQKRYEMGVLIRRSKETMRYSDIMTCHSMKSHQMTWQCAAVEAPGLTFERNVSASKCTTLSYCVSLTTTIE